MHKFFHFHIFLEPKLTQFSYGLLPLWLHAKFTKIALPFIYTFSEMMLGQVQASHLITLATVNQPAPAHHEG
jgi:hypothetical protein